jgi:hypothetical protein
METKLAKALSKWFVLHFWADMLFAIPLMIAPEFLLQSFGATFLAMLNLKIIWSLAAILGIAWSLAEGAQGRPLMAWLLLAVFVAFNIVWIYWRRKLSSP